MVARYLDLMVVVGSSSPSRLGGSSLVVACKHVETTDCQRACTGVWENWVSEVAADYVQLPDYENVDFEDYLKGCVPAARVPHEQSPPNPAHAQPTLCRRLPEITALNGMGKRTKPYRDATAKNNAFIAQRRCNARDLLRSAHAREVLPYLEATDTAVEVVGTGSVDDGIVAY